MHYYDRRVLVEIQQLHTIKIPYIEDIPYKTAVLNTITRDKAH